MRAMSLFAVLMILAPGALADEADLVEEVCSIAVLDLQAQGLSADQAHVPKILTDTIATEAAHLSPGCRVITQADIAQMLDYEAQKAACGDEAMSCIAEIGGALGVGHVIGGSVGKLGSTYTLQAKYIDIKRAVVLQRVEIDVEGDVGQLRKAAKQIAEQLLGAAPVGGSGTTAEPSAEKGEGGGNGVFLWSGVGLTAVGLVVTTIGAVGAAGADAALGDPATSNAAKNDALGSGPALFFTAIGGAVVTAAGIGLIGLGLLE